MHTRFWKLVAWTWTWTRLLENRGMDMDMDTEFFESRGVDIDMVMEFCENCGVVMDMDSAWNRCPPNSAIDSQMISGYEESKSYIADRFQWDRLKSSDLNGP